MESTRRTTGTGSPILGLHAQIIEGINEGLESRAGDVIRIGTAADNDLVVHDEPTVSRYHVELRRSGSHIEVRDRSTNGTRIGSCTVRNQNVLVAPNTVISVGSTQVRASDGALEVVPLGPTSFGRLLGSGDAIRRVFSDARRVAQTHVPVLIGGESGTGKELLAEAVHEHSARCERKLETFDCGAIAPTLVASELFGHEKGAFTGADRRHEGAFERAHDGTLFLDEVGELPEAAQAMLLGVLERGSFVRVGGSKPVSVDVRVIAATHRDLHHSVNEGTFRHDLFFRLAVVRLDLPPLRERMEDLTQLLDRLFAKSGCPDGRGQFVDDSVMALLRQHSWPGNIRELRNWVQSTAALGRPTPLMRISNAQDRGGYSSLLELPFKVAKGELIGEFERAYLKRLMERTAGNVRAASRLAEINRSYLIELLDKHEVGS